MKTGSSQNQQTASKERSLCNHRDLVALYTKIENDMAEISTNIPSLRPRLSLVFMHALRRWRLTARIRCRDIARLRANMSSTKECFVG